VRNRSPRNKRSRYVVDRDFQFKLVGAFLLLIVVAFVIFSAGAGLYYWLRYVAGENVFKEFITVQRQITVTDAQGRTRTATEDLPPVNRIEIVLPPLLINNLVVLVVVAVIGLFYSHRIAGAAHRIDADVQRALDGERDVEIRLRRTDELQSLAKRINRLIEELDRLR
jgi:methyl-accepting chemotaxis protein